METKAEGVVAHRENTQNVTNRRGSWWTHNRSVILQWEPRLWTSEKSQLDPDFRNRTEPLGAVQDGLQVLPQDAHPDSSIGA